MKEKLLRIVNYYGIRKQIKYFMTEVYELIEAVVEMEEAKKDPLSCVIRTVNMAFNPNYKDWRKNHISEEIGDCYVMIEQVRQYYGITNEELKEIIKSKIDRQILRIEKEEAEQKLKDFENKKEVD